VTRLVLDTNVIVSSLLFSGSSTRLAGLWQAGRFRLAATREVVLEYSRVLGYAKFKLAPPQIAAFLAEDLLPFVDVFEAPSRRPSPLPEDKSDVKFLQAALASQARALVSGDSHLLRLNEAYPFPIISPTEALKLFPG
jgi:putative PIN family toxin of toxin-antitoxin system